MGTPNALPCNRGTHNPNKSATSEQACLECDEGFFCGLGQVEQRPCPLGEFCTRGTSASVSCSNQVVGSTTLGEGRGRSTTDCVCKATFMMDGNPPIPGVNDTRACISCPSQGVRCNTEGVSLIRLELEDGFWRAHNRSTNIKRCFEPERCVPHTNENGTFTPCAPGNIGPLCQVCEPDHYYSLANGMCIECTGSEAATFLIPLVVLILFVVVLVYSCLNYGQSQVQAKVQTWGNEAVQTEVDGTVEDAVAEKYEEVRAKAVVKALAPIEFVITQAGGKPCMQRLKEGWKRLKARSEQVMVKVRILISLIQVLSALGVVFVIPYPPIYDEMVSWLSIFELDLIDVMPLSCTFVLNFHHLLLLRTLVPLAAILLLYVIGQVLLAKRERQLERESQAASNTARAGDLEQAHFGSWLAQNLFTAAFFLLFLIYPSISQNIFATFQCFPVEEVHGNARYLRADASIDCDAAAHRGITAYAIVMMFVYPLGTPVLYIFLLRCRYGRMLRNLRSIEMLTEQHHLQKRALQRYKQWSTDSLPMEETQENEESQALHLQLKKIRITQIDSSNVDIRFKVTNEQRSHLPLN